MSWYIIGWVRGMHICDTKYGLQLPESKVCWNNLRWVGLDWVLGRCLGARLREVAKSWALLGATAGEQLGRPCNARLDRSSLQVTQTWGHAQTLRP